MRLTLAVLTFAVATIATTSVASADEDLGYEPGFIELGLGATNIEATTGSGRLTAGVSQDGDLTMLSWPSPSYWDQMHYMTTNAEDARARPRFGAGEGMGAFSGLVYSDADTGDQTVTYFRGDDWDVEVGFVDYDAAVVETTYTSEELGLEVRQYDIIPEDHDVLTRRFVVERDEASPVEDASLIGYANLSPNLSKIEQIPLVDGFLDHKNDFLAVWQEERDALMHFHPGDTGIMEEIGQALANPNRDFGPLGELLEDETPDATQIDQLAGELDEHYAEGVYVAMSSSPRPTEFQVGEDHSDTCGILDEVADNVKTLQDRYPDKSLPASPDVVDQGRCGDFEPLEYPRDKNDWSYSAEDAFDDLQDGELTGDRLAGGQVNTATLSPLEFDQQRAEAALYFAFGESDDKAHQQLDWARDQDLEQLQDEVVQADRDYIDDLWISEEFDEEMRRFSQRTFLNMRAGTDRESGAIVASVSRQPSYQLDWPRDGAFFNIALDLAGQHELVSRRMDFYSEAIRDEAESPVPLLNEPVPGWPDNENRDSFPPDSWEMNYYADGTPGGNIRLEIDNTALLVWSYVYHVGHLEGDERDEYIQDVWPTVERAAEWLHFWRDEETGLNWYANEDDHIQYTQGLQGSSTTYGALVSAARLARYIDEDELADKWLERAGELKAATIEHMYVDGEGFRGHPDPEEPGAGSPHWLGWPTRMFPPDDERYLPQLRDGLAGHLEDVRGETAGGQYPTKVAISGALVLDDDGREDAYEIAERLATDIANPRTYTLGEHFSTLDADGDGETDGWVNGVSTPHLWSMALVYLTAVAYHHPERFDAYDDVLPEVDVPEVDPPGSDGDAGDTGDTGDEADAGGDADQSQGQDPGDDGCGCRSTPSGVPGEWVVFGLVVLWWRRRCG